LAEVSSCVPPESSKQMGRSCRYAAMVRRVHLPLAVGMLQAMQGSATPLAVNGPGHPFTSMLCSVDMGQAVMSMAEVATDLEGVVTLCHNDTDTQERGACAGMLGQLFAALMLHISYTMQELTACFDTPKVRIVDATCAADMTGLMNGFMHLWSSTAAFTTGVCKDTSRRLESRALIDEVPANELPEYNQYKFLKGTVRDYDQTIRDLHRKLYVPGTPSKPSAANVAEIANCLISAMHTPMYIIRAITALHAGMENCHQVDMNNQTSKIFCTVAIANLLGALYFTAMYASSLSTTCAPNDLQAVCSMEIASVLTVFTSIVGYGADFPLSCGKVKLNVTIPTVLGNPDRRLAGNSSGKPPVFI